MNLYIFTSDTCPKCSAVKKEITQIATKLSIKIENVIIGDKSWQQNYIAAYLNVLTVPTIIAFDMYKYEIARWCNFVPTIKEIEKIRNL